MQVEFPEHDQVMIFLLALHSPNVEPLELQIAQIRSLLITLNEKSLAIKHGIHTLLRQFVIVYLYRGAELFLHFLSYSDQRHHPPSLVRCPQLSLSRGFQSEC